VTDSCNSPQVDRRYGRVDLATSGTISPDAILGADPGCRLVIGPGVCLGSGVLIRASQGDLVIDTGASLGMGVLVVGRGRIGRYACIGANSTLINPEVADRQVLAPDTLLGDPSAPRSSSGSNGRGAASEPAGGSDRP
jgi:carbon dioxide concentrating mechanism protein CcmN